jgi:hypothetical protein
MPSLDLIDLLGLYARRGIDDWNGAAHELRKRAQVCLGTAIAENVTEAFVTIQTIYNEANANRLRFIPMPKHPKGGIERCFFLPVREIKAGGQEKVAFELFLLVARTDCLAFRFEPAHAFPSTHGYGHVQFSRKMLRRTIEVPNIPDWFPVSYPAFAISTSDPLRMFLSMATAVHGYSSGLVSVLQDIFQTASRAADSAAYLNELKKMLN